MRRTTCLLILFAFLGCATGTVASKLQKGMTKQEVVEIMGQPDQTRKKGEYEGLRYVAKGSSQLDKHTIYHVILNDGKVIEHGAGTVKIEDANGNIIMFLPFE